MSQSNNKISLNNNDPNHLKAIVYAIITFNIVFDLKLNITICNDDADAAYAVANPEVAYYKASAAADAVECSDASYAASHAASAAAYAAQHTARYAARYVAQYGTNISPTTAASAADHAADAAAYAAQCAEQSGSTKYSTSSASDACAYADEVCKTINLSNIKDDVKIVKHLLIAYYYLKICL